MTNYRTFRVLCGKHRYTFINKTASETAIIVAKRIYKQTTYNEDIQQLHIKVIETTCGMPQIEYNYLALRKPFMIHML